MGYRFETTGQSYADLASGAVLRSAPGFPAFPVRLASEMFLRGLEAVQAKGPVTVWDPCCGSGYLITVLALLHRERICDVVASDIDDSAVALARRNLSLLTRNGLRARLAELAERSEKFGKPSHAESANAAWRLSQSLAGTGGDLLSGAHVADVFDTDQLVSALHGRTPHMVITDVPYGEQTAWRGRLSGTGTPGMARSVASVLPPEAVLVVAVRGRKVPLGERVAAVERFKIGTRSVAIVRAGDLLHSRPKLSPESVRESPTGYWTRRHRRTPPTSTAWPSGSPSTSARPGGTSGVFLILAG
jgi:23S rRNA (guanine2535-N1)-methyltransferase